MGSKLAEEFQQGIALALAEEGKTVIFMKDDKGIIAAAALQDTLRPEAVQAIQDLKNAGIFTVMLTGDNEKTAAAIAKEAGIDSYVAECLPETKVDYLKQLLMTIKLLLWSETASMMPLHSQQQHLGLPWETGLMLHLKQLTSF